MTAASRRPTRTCGRVYTPHGPHWDGTNTHIAAMARAAGWRIWAGTTLGGSITAVIICPACVGEDPA